MGSLIKGEYMNTTLDLTAIPFMNLIVIIIALFGFIFVMRKLGVTSVGPLKLEYRDQGSMNAMNKANLEADSALRDRMRDFVDELWETMASAFNCEPIISYAVSSSLCFPFYKTVNNNHFTTVLLPENIEAYRDRILVQLKNRYNKIVNVSNGHLPPYEENILLIEGWLDLFLRTLKGETNVTCREKISIYQKYKKSMCGDYWKDIIEECIEKNKRYAEVIHK